MLFDRCEVYHYSIHCADTPKCNWVPAQFCNVVTAHSRFIHSAMETLSFVHWAKPTRLQWWGPRHTSFNNHCFCRCSISTGIAFHFLCHSCYRIRSLVSAPSFIFFLFLHHSSSINLRFNPSLNQSNHFIPLPIYFMISILVFQVMRWIRFCWCRI